MKPFNQMADAIPVALENPEALIHGILQQANHPEKIVNQIYDEYVSLMIRLGSPEAGTRGEAFGEFVSNTFLAVATGGTAGRAVNKGAKSSIAVSKKAIQESITFQKVEKAATNQLPKHPTIGLVVQFKPTSL